MTKNSTTQIYKMSIKNTKERCIRGHLMSESRKRRPGGSTYCSQCKKEVHKENYIPKTRFKKEKIILTIEEKQEKNRIILLKTKYNMTNEDYNQMFVNQNGKCAICNLDLASLYRAASIDHNHTTGRIRGLLCNQCNAGIGFLKDDIDVLKSAITYLQNN